MGVGVLYVSITAGAGESLEGTRSSPDNRDRLKQRNEGEVTIARTLMC